MGILAFLAQLGIGTIATKIASAYEAKQKASTDQERIAAEERIKHLEAIRAVQVAESGSRINSFIRAGFALPVMLYYAKIFLVDKAFGLGRTDPLSPELYEIAMVVIGFYFVSETAARVARIFKR